MKSIASYAGLDEQQDSANILAIISNLWYSYANNLRKGVALMEAAEAGFITGRAHEIADTLFKDSFHDLLTKRYTDEWDNEIRTRARQGYTSATLIFEDYKCILDNDSPTRKRLMDHFKNNGFDTEIVNYNGNDRIEIMVKWQSR